MKKLTFLVILLCLTSHVRAQYLTPDQGYYWWGPSAVFNTSALQNICMVWNGSSCSQWESWSFTASAAATHYVTNTNMTGGYGPNGEGTIVLINSYWPQIPYTGAAIGVTSGGIYCAAIQSGVPTVTGNCNKNTLRPVISYTYFNDLFFDNRYSPTAQIDFQDFGYRVMLHELGHTLGMGHNNNFFMNSFMQDPIPDTSATSLHWDEISWINTYIQ
jgi:hypothetical protein